MHNKKYNQVGSRLRQFKYRRFEFELGDKSFQWVLFKQEDDAILIFHFINFKPIKD